MNKTDDGVPVGEAPDLSGLGRMLAAADGIRDKTERQARALREIRALHFSRQNICSALHPQSLCSCGAEEPCPTVRIIDRNGIA